MGKRIKFSWNDTFEIYLQVEVKPYVLDDQLCDECQGARCGGKFAPFFCANVTCLQVKLKFHYEFIRFMCGNYVHYDFFYFYSKWKSEEKFS